MNTLNLDKADLAILSILQNEGRLPIVELAKRIHLTTTPCAERVKRLEKLGIIESYHAKVSADKLGLALVVFIHVRLDQTCLSVFDQFERDVKTIDMIEECYSLTGEFDAMIKVRVSGMPDYQNFMATELPKLTGVIQTRSEVVIKQIKSRNELFTGVLP